MNGEVESLESSNFNTSLGWPRNLNSFSGSQDACNEAPQSRDSERFCLS